MLSELPVKCVKPSVYLALTYSFRQRPNVSLMGLYKDRISIYWAFKISSGHVLYAHVRNGRQRVFEFGLEARYSTRNRNIFLIFSFCLFFYYSFLSLPLSLSLIKLLSPHCLSLVSNFESLSSTGFAYREHSSELEKISPALALPGSDLLFRGVDWVVLLDP